MARFVHPRSDLEPVSHHIKRVVEQPRFGPLGPEAPAMVMTVSSRTMPDRKPLIIRNVLQGESRRGTTDSVV